MATLKFKRGASFLFAGPVKINGAIHDMTGWTARSQLRAYSNVDGSFQENIGEVISDLPVSWMDAAQGILRIGDNEIDTSQWPLGKAVLDIEFTTPLGSKVFTESQSVIIVERATQ